ncbi:MAG: ZIP family metal transporter [Bacilli bacterium]
MFEISIGIFIPFIGTCLGAAMVFFMKNKINNKLEKILLGFASGVMMAASIWSLLIPAIEQSSQLSNLSWFPAALGFLLGMGFLLLLDSIIPHLHLKSDKPEGVKSKFKKTTMLMFAVTLHNIPEGMAVGIVLASAYMGSVEISMSSAFVLAIGIAIQNFPEGAIISMPLKTEGLSKTKSFFYGVLSGLAEIMGALITIFLTQIISPTIPYLLAFAAGAMIYVIVEELIPESQDGQHSNLATIGVAVGFVLMMVLDITLG